MIKQVRLPSNKALAHVMIPDWLINPTPDERIVARQFGVLVDFNDIERYFRRMDEIVYEVSEEMFCYP